MPAGGLSEAEQRHLGQHVSSFVPQRDVVRIGRDPSNDVEVRDDLRASRRHAELRLRNGRWEVQDLNSANGTFVNGTRISKAVLSDGDLLAVGNHLFVFRAGQLEEYSAVDGTSLDAIGVTVMAGSATLLQNVSFSLPSRSMLAVVGPSGAGKSTLLRALTGVLTPSQGQVRFAGRDLHGSYEEFRSRIGSVPQDDLVHPELTPRTELELSAALRLPTDIGRDGRRARVDQVLAELGLTERADLQISKLSGGQRKRVSVGTELLTQPTLLFLDEPTSGLDPGNEKQVMTVLRQLANGGRVVVVVTHATQSLDLADRVLFLARGGRVAYFGPPADALAYFARHGVPGGFADVFRALDDPGDLDWQAIFQGDPDYDRFVGAAVRQAAGRVSAGRPAGRAVSAVPAAAQFRVLIQRQRRIITGDRKTMILLSVQAPIFGVIIALLYPSHTLSTNSGPFAALLLWLLVISATWLGASGTIREIVKELAIYRRERAVGLSIPAYVGSKFAVFGAITVVQSFIVALIGLSRQTLPPIDSQNFVVLLHAFRPSIFRGLRPFAVGSVISSQQLEVLIAVALSGLAGTGLGLAISALVRKSDQAVFLLPVVLVIEMALSLPLLKLDNSSPFIQIGSKVVSAGWGLSALGSTVSLNQLLTPYRWALTFGERDVAYDLHALQAQVNHRPAPPFPPIPVRELNQALSTDPSWQHSGSAWFTAVLVLILMTAVFCAIAVVALRRLDIGRQSRQLQAAR
jgi:ABC transport system ATP-binding/permease protein